MQNTAVSAIVRGPIFRDLLVHDTETMPTQPSDDVSRIALLRAKIL